MDSVKHLVFNTITENVFTTDAQFKNAQSDQVPESNYDGQIKTFTTQHGAQGLNNPSGIPGIVNKHKCFFKLGSFLIFWFILKIVLENLNLKIFYQ